MCLTLNGVVAMVAPTVPSVTLVRRRLRLAEMVSDLETATSSADAARRTLAVFGLKEQRKDWKSSDKHRSRIRQQARCSIPTEFSR